MTPITLPFAASAASAAIFIEPDAAAAVDERRCRARRARVRSPRPPARTPAACRRCEPQKRQMRFIAQLVLRDRVALRLRHRQAALGAPPQHVVGRARPLLAHEVVDLARGERRRRSRRRGPPSCARRPAPSTRACRGDARARRRSDGGRSADSVARSSRGPRGAVAVGQVAARQRRAPPSTRAFMPGKYGASSRSACSASLR